MNEVDSCCLPSVRKGKKSGKRKFTTTGIARSTGSTKYANKGILKALSTEKRPPSK